MRFLIILTAFYILTPGCKFEEERDADPIKVKLPEGSKPQSLKGKNVLVKVTADNKIFVGDKELALSKIDSLLAIELNKNREHNYDSITVVINADSASTYGVIFKITKAAKRERAKVVVSVDGY